MLTLLAVFLLGSLLMPVLVRWLGSQAFAIAALIPAQPPPITRTSCFPSTAANLPEASVGRSLQPAGSEH